MHLVIKKVGQENNAILGDGRELVGILNYNLEPLFLQLYLHLVSVQAPFIHNYCTFQHCASGSL